jgi:hypothetical protein
VKKPELIPFATADELARAVASAWLRKLGGTACGRPYISLQNNYPEIGDADTAFLP